MFANSTQITALEGLIVSLLNAATGGFGASIDDARRNATLITQARLKATTDVIRAIARNPSNGYWGAIALPVNVLHNQLLPEHEGEIGIPEIVPFTNAQPRAGVPADPDDIDSYRNDFLGLYTRAFGVSTAHNMADVAGMPSRVSGYYSIVANRIKFTGATCKIPMIQLTDSTLNSKLPYAYVPTVAKLAPMYALKEGDNIMSMVQMLYADGKQDLQMIMQGAMATEEIIMEQKNV